MVQVMAVQKVPYTIKYIANPSEKVQMEAIQQNPYLISEISNLCEEAQLMAIQKNQNLYCRLTIHRRKSNLRSLESYIKKS